MSTFAFEAVLFDMDGVILDSMERHAQTWQELLADCGLKVPKSYILENEGSLGPEALLDFLRDRGLEQGPEQGALERMDELLALQAQTYLECHAPHVKPYEGAAELLAALKEAGVPTALVTSSRRSVVRGCLSPELLKSFGALVCAEDVTAHKPDPEPYLKAAAALGKKASRCLAVENAPAGIESALAAGSTCFAVLSTLGPEHLRRAQALFRDLRHLRAGLGLGE